MKIKEIINTIEQLAPLGIQESFDNSGVQTGDVNCEATGVLLCIDVTEAVVQEAIEMGCNLIVSHHPLAFRPFKSLTGRNYIERCIVEACKHDLVVYAAHTSVDNAAQGINFYLANLLNLQNIRVLAPLEQKLAKLVTFVPHSHAEVVRNALFNAGAGQIGNYDMCSYNLSGEGSFRPLPGTNPYCGETNVLHTEDEMRIEVVLPVYRQSEVMQALIAVHPYEEPAYDFYPLLNRWGQVGSGMVGTLPEAMEEEDFLYLLKDVFHLHTLQHSTFRQKPVRDVALCSGSGAFLIPQAISYGADVFITGEAKYNDYYDVEKNILLTVVGHYESEIFTKNVFFDCISKKYPTFAVYMSREDNNPVNYL